MVAHDKTLDKFLRAAGDKLGTKLSLDKNGICILKKNENEREYIVELPRSSDVVYFYAAVCRVPYGCAEEFFEKILESNLCGIEYNQATFGLDPKTQNIVISYTRSMQSLDEVSFSNILVNFINTTDRARESLTKLSKDLSEAATLTEDDIQSELNVRKFNENLDKMKV